MKKIKITVCLLLCVTLCAALLSACAKPPSGDAVMSYEGSVITDRAAAYWLSFLKYTYVNIYNDLTYDKETWIEKLPDGSGKTYAEALIEASVTEMKYTLASLYLFKKNKLKLAASDRAEVDLIIDAASKYFGSRAKFNRYLINDYGLTVDSYRYILEAERKVYAVADFYTGKNGKLDITDEQRDEYYKKNFARVKIIYFNTEADYAYDKDGYAIVNETNGLYLTYAIIEEADRQAKVNTARSVWEKVEQGEDFDGLLASYGDLRLEFKRDTPSGRYVTADINRTGAAVAGKLFGEVALADGDVAYVSDSKGIYIIKREPLENYAYLKGEYTAQFYNPTLGYDFIAEANAAIYRDSLARIFDDITVTAEYFEKLDVNSLQTTFIPFWYQWYN